MNKCKAPGCGKWVLHDDKGYCTEHEEVCQLDPISALYVDKTPEEMELDEKVCGFFSYLLHNRSLEELLN